MYCKQGDAVDYDVFDISNEEKKLKKKRLSRNCYYTIFYQW